MKNKIINNCSHLNFFSIRPKDILYVKYCLLDEVYNFGLDTVNKTRLGEQDWSL